MIKKKCTINDVAKKAGVSIATVSRVLNKNGGYSDELARLVEESARELGYRRGSSEKKQVPNRIQRETQKLIGILVPDITNSYFSGIVLELQKCLWTHGYAAVIYNVNESEEMAGHYMDILLEQPIQGMIYICGYETNIVYESLEDRAKLPVVYIDRHPVGKNQEAVVVKSDNFKGGYLAAKELLENGCRRPGFLTDSLGMSSKKSRFNGYMRALERAGIAAEEDWILEVGQKGLHEIEEAICRKISAGWNVDGIMCTTDKLAVGAILGVQKAGKKVPGDVKVTGFDDTDIAETFRPGITTIHQNGELMAQKAVDFLMKLIDGGEVEKKHYIVPVTVSCRESTGK